MSCKCDGSGWVQIGEQAVFLDTCDGRGDVHTGWEPLMEPCDCVVPDEGSNEVPDYLDEAF